jgi:transketolase
MRKEFGKIITEFAEKDREIILITGDIGYGIFDEFRKRFPDRFLNIGICEQSMIGVAAGMALEGMKPWVYTITPFLIERPFEQIKLDIAQQNANVKLVGYGDYPKQGPTHMAINERGLIGLLNNIEPFFPENLEDVRNAVSRAYHSKNPAFISLKQYKR